MENLQFKVESQEKNLEEKVESEILKNESTLYFTFKLGDDLYGFDVKSVLEILEYEKVFKTPGVHMNIRGLINLRGDVLPVIDLYARFFNKKNEILESTSIVVLEVKDNNEIVKIGVLIDSIEAVIDIFDKEIEKSPEVGLKIRQDFISGIGKSDNEFIILLDVNKVLNIEELSQLGN